MAGLETQSGTASASTSASYVTLTSTVPGFKYGYIYNSGSVNATIYLNATTADDSTKAQVIPAGMQYQLDNPLSGPLQSFRYKTASSTTTLEYHFYN